MRRVGEECFSIVASSSRLRERSRGGDVDGVDMFEDDDDEVDGLDVTVPAADADDIVEDDADDDDVDESAPLESVIAC